MASIYTKDITGYLEAKAPLNYQEGYDNAGLLTGHGRELVSGVLVTLDITEAVLYEASQKGCNMVVAHHPLIFKGLKSVNGKNYVERTLIHAIKHDMVLYAAHTNLDAVSDGVSKSICDRLGLVNRRVLQPRTQQLLKLTTFVPVDHIEQVSQALFHAGAGSIGNYTHCGFTVQGEGTFMPQDGANPYIGVHNQLERVAEIRLEVMLPTHLKRAVLQALHHAHPYEEVAYYLQVLENANQELGFGMVGELEQPIQAMDFLHLLKDRMRTGCVRHTELCRPVVQKIAVCGGSGSSLLSLAKGVNADVYVTGDFKYHEFFDAEGEIIIADIGHFESEQFTIALLSEWLQQAFPTLKVLQSEVRTNPVYYF